MIMDNQQGITVSIELQNMDMASMLFSLEPFLESATGKFGYAVARNVRKLREACTEFLQIRQNLIQELGEKKLDEEGRFTGTIAIDTESDKFLEYGKRLGEVSDISHTVEIYKIPYELLPDSITAKDMLTLEWMLIEDNGEL